MASKRAIGVSVEHQLGGAAAVEKKEIARLAAAPRERRQKERLQQESVFASTIEHGAAVAHHR